MTTDRREGGIEWVAKYRQTQFSRRSSSTLKKDVQSCNSGSKIVAVMQPAQLWHGYDPAICAGIFPCFTTGRRSFRQREMRSIFMVVTDILFHQPLQMTLIKDDDMIEQILDTQEFQQTRHEPVVSETQGYSTVCFAAMFDGEDQ